MHTRDLLILQRNRLVELSTPDAQDWAIERAVRMIRRIDAALQDTDQGLEDRRGTFGDNGWEPRVDMICRDLAYRPSPDLMAHRTPALAKAA